MKRCAGDLKSLVIQKYEVAIGASDAMEFYYRNALGEVGLSFAAKPPMIINKLSSSF
jgi:hypothetical protein